MFEAMRMRVEQLGNRLTNAKKMNFSRPLEVLTSWQQELKTHDRDRTEKHRLIAESEAKQYDGRHTQHQLEAAELRRSAVLARAGVSSREELTKQQESEARRVQLVMQLKKPTKN